MRLVRPLPALIPVLLLTLVVGVLQLITAPPPADAAGRVPDAACRPSNPALRTGICFRFPDGSVTWLGNFTSASGRVFFCIDKGKGSRLPATAPRHSTRRLKNQFGRPIGRSEVAALNYLVDKWGPGASESVAAGIGLIIRQVMSDSRGQMPSGLTVGDQVRDLRGGLPASVLDGARRMWAEASRLRGPWRIRWEGTLADLTVGERRTLRAVVVSGARRLVPHARVRLAYSDNAAGPSSLRTSRRGRARGTVTATAPGELRVRASVKGPAANGTLFDPRDPTLQRGWIAERSSDRARVSGVRVRVVHPDPRITTETSLRVVAAGTPFHDVVRVRGLPEGRSATLTARLYGPYPAPPGETDCRAGELVATVRRTITGSGTYPMPATVQRKGGYYGWVAALSATAITRSVTHPCGVATETTLVERNRPTLRTQVSTQRAARGSRLVDTITVQGLLTGETVQVRWTLYGPVPPDPQAGCSRVSWRAARVHDAGALTVARNGSFRTPSSAPLQALGCYTFGERLIGTPVVADVVHPPGLVSQSTRVDRSRPRLRTQVSQQIAVRGARLRDTIWVSGLLPGERVRGRWELTSAPTVRGRCTAVAWARALRQGRARVVDQGTFVASRNGRLVTRWSRRLTAPRCYTYSERIARSATTYGAWHQPGKVSQTTLVRKPGRPDIPSGPTGWLRASHPRAAAGRISIPALGRPRIPVRPVSSRRGALALPVEADVVGWWQGSAPPRAGHGSSVIAGHVTDRAGAPGALHRLGSLRVGDRIVWRTAGRRTAFVVIGKTYTPRTGALPARIWRLAGPRRLHLVTCARKVVYRSGFYHYTHNVTVTAKPKRA